MIGDIPQHTRALDPTMLILRSDLPVRRRYFVPASFAHPAKLHLGLLQWIIDRYTEPGCTIADPMAGIGSILLAATQDRNVIAREIEPRWLAVMQKNAMRICEMAGLFIGHIDVDQADARDPWDYTADHIICSPPYGCAISPHATTRKGMLSRRLRQLGTGTLSKRWEELLRQGDDAGAMGAELFHYGEHPAQIGHFRGMRYWDAMRQIYMQAHTALQPGGLLILILKDHIRKGVRIRTCDQTVALCTTLGFTLSARHQRRLCIHSLWTRRRKEHGATIVEEEEIIVLQRNRVR